MFLSVVRRLVAGGVIACLQVVLMVVVGDGINPCAALGFSATSRWRYAVSVGIVSELVDAEVVEVDVVRLPQWRNSAALVDRWCSWCVYFNGRVSTGRLAVVFVEPYVRALYLESLLVLRFDNPSCASGVYRVDSDSGAI